MARSSGAREKEAARESAESEAGTPAENAGAAGGNEKSQDQQLASLRPDSARIDAVALQDLLRRSVSNDETGPSSLHEASARPVVNKRANRRWPSRLLKTLVGTAILVTVGWMPAQRLFEVSSVEAVVNARTVTVRAPIAGVVAQAKAGLSVGQKIAADEILVSVNNQRAERYRYEDARRQLAEERQRYAVLVERLAGGEKRRTELERQLKAFRASRIRQLEAGIGEADARVRSAAAILDNVRAARNRQVALQNIGVVSQAALGDANSDLRVAAAARDVAIAERDALNVELESLRSGLFVGDSYNDQPRTAQRLDEVADQIASLGAEAGQSRSRISLLEADVERERRALDLLVGADLMAPVSGQVWEILTAPGEAVVTGQPLFSLLDCSRPVVTAVVSEAVYNSLSIGQQAAFRYREGGPEIEGKVVQLSGVAEASSNFAIMPSALQKEAYRVTVALEGDLPSGSCPVGRTGRVVFEKPSGAK